MTVGGFTNISLPAIEKRFQFNSKELGLIAASNDISSVLLICFVSFYGQFGNKVKWLGYGTIITGLCIRNKNLDLLTGETYRLVKCIDPKLNGTSGQHVRESGKCLLV